MIFIAGPVAASSLQLSGPTIELRGGSRAMRHEFVEKLVATFAGKVGAPAATLAAKVLGKDAYVSPTGRVDPVLKDEAKVKDAWTKIVNEYSRALGTNLVYALLSKLKLELGIK